MIRWQQIGRPLRRHGKATLGGLAMIGLAAFAAGALRPSTPMIVYNASRSAPLGFYRVTPLIPLSRGDLVLVETPASVRKLADTRGYLPATVPMIKHVTALSGDTVCAHADRILVNGTVIAGRQKYDHLHRVMPWWEGCRTLGMDDVFLLNPAAPLSFDGRYFGVASVRLIRGKLVRP